MADHNGWLINKGLALVSEILAEKGAPHFWRAECGAGRPDNPDEIRNMSGLIDPRYEMQIKKSFADDQTIMLNIQLDNIDVEQAFELTEIIIYLRNDATGEEAPYVYVYYEHGDFVPVGKYLRKIIEHNIDTELIVEECEVSVPDDNGVYLTPHDLIDHDSNPQAHGGSKIVVIPEGETIPVSNRNPETFYLQVTDTSAVQPATGTILVSPTMGIKIVD